MPVTVGVPDPRRGDRDEVLQGFLLAISRVDALRSAQDRVFRRALRDLSGPLTALGGYCGLLLDQRLGPLSQQQLEVIGQMQQNVERIARHLNSTIHLSQGALDPSEVHLRPGDLTVILDRAVSEATPGAEAREIDLQLHIDPPLETLHFDHVLIYGVFACLVGNACRFTAVRGVVDIRAYPVKAAEDPETKLGLADGSGQERRARDAYRIDVRDSGPSIPAAQLASVFDLTAEWPDCFERSESWLELGMCRLIMQAHGGEVHVESGESGTVFSVILPPHPLRAATD